MNKILILGATVLIAIAGCTKFEPSYPGRGGYNPGGSGGNGGNGGNNAGTTASLKQQSAWKIEYKGRTIFTEDGSNDTVEGFFLTYTGNAYYIVRMVEAGTVTDEIAFFKEQAAALDDSFKDDPNHVFQDSRLVYFDLLIHGNWDVYMIEISSAKAATLSYQKAEVTVKEDDPSAAYLKWIGSWRLSNGLIGYDIDVEHVENNLLYRVWGWESGPAAMNQDMGEDWLFARFDPDDDALVFYVQTIGEDNDPKLGRFDKVFVGTWSESTGETVDDLEGAPIARTGENESGSPAIVPEAVDFDNGAVLFYHYMRFSSYGYNNQQWYHYNASVPELYKYVEKEMTYPLAMTPLTKSVSPALYKREISPRDRRLTPTVHAPGVRRNVSE